MEICSICEEIRIVNFRGCGGRPECQACHRKSRKERCSICRNVRAVNSRDDENRPICSACWGVIHAEVCSGCSRSKAVATRNKQGVAVCAACLSKLNPKECCVCHMMKRVAARPGGVPICANCRVMTNPRMMYKLYIRGSNRRRLDFSLTYEQFAVLAASDCHYCGERHERFCTGIDGADNSKGYVDRKSVV